MSELRRRGEAAVRVVVAAGVLALLSGAASAATCEKDTIASVSAGGEIIEMRSGNVFRIEPIGRRLAASWPPVSEMKICLTTAQGPGASGEAYSLSNLDDDGQTVEAQRQKR